MVVTPTDMLCLILLLFLAAPTWLWGRCGRHNSLPVSSVMNFIFCRSDASHVSLDTVHTYLFRSSSLPFPGGTISRVFRPTYSWSSLLTCPNHLNLAFLHLSAMFSTLILYLMSSFLTWSLSVWPHAHLHISILSHLNDHLVDLSLHVWWYYLIA